MVYSEPLQILVDEHDVIVSVIEVVEAVSQKPDARGIAPCFHEHACGFFSAFADQWHHAKEEAHLFPMLEARGIPRVGGLVGCMLNDHDKGRGYLATIREALDSVAQGHCLADEVVRLASLKFCDFLRQHIATENQVLFVLGDQAMNDDDKSCLAEAFRRRQGDDRLRNVSNEHIRVAEELRKAAGLGLIVRGLSCRGGSSVQPCHMRSGRPPTRRGVRAGS